VAKPLEWSRPSVESVSSVVQKQTENQPRITRIKPYPVTGPGRFACGLARTRAGLGPVPRSTRTVTRPQAGMVRRPSSGCSGRSLASLRHSRFGAGSLQTISVWTARPAAPQRRTMSAWPSSLGLMPVTNASGELRRRRGKADGFVPRAALGSNGWLAAMARREAASGA